MTRWLAGLWDSMHSSVSGCRQRQQRERAGEREEMRRLIKSRPEVVSPRHSAADVILRPGLREAIDWLNYTGIWPTCQAVRFQLCFRPDILPLPAEAAAQAVPMVSSGGYWQESQSREHTHGRTRQRPGRD